TTYVSRLEYRRPGSEHAPPRTLHALRSYALTLLLFALGLMSKPMLVTLPFVLLLLDYWPLGRLRFGNSGGARTFLSAATSNHPKSDSSVSVSNLAHRCGQECPRSALGYLVWEKIPFFAL